MDDLISRQWLVECVDEGWIKFDTEKDRNTYIHLVRDIAPSAQPGWIPCSERLPEDYTDVLVWFEYYRYGDYNCLYQMHGIGNYMAEYDSWMINHETGWRELRVFAWMPLPAPWKGEKE
jgi:hypothetical protein